MDLIESLKLPYLISEIALEKRNLGFTYYKCRKFPRQLLILGLAIFYSKRKRNAENRGKVQHFK